MFQIDAMSRVPIYEQIIEQLERFIMTDLIKAGEQIPSVRSVSMELSINPVTILKAYSELDSRGLIHSVPGKGYFVCDNVKKTLAENKMKRLDELSKMVSEMALLGIPKKKISDVIDSAYESLQNSKENL